MKIRKNLLIFDTETVGTFGKPLIHDLGYVILNKNLEIVCKKRFLVKELHGDGQWLLNTSDFFSKYKEDYKIARKHERIVSFKLIFKEMLKDISTYKVNTICAYNAQFDIKALEYTEKFFTQENKMFEKLMKKNILCIWNLACETIGLTAKFHSWAYENGMVNAKNHISTSAETMYQYITGNVSYIEAHTALSDSLDEKEILVYCLKHFKGNVEYGLKYNCWMKAQE